MGNVAGQESRQVDLLEVFENDLLIEQWSENKVVNSVDLDSVENKIEIRRVGLTIIDTENHTSTVETQPLVNYKRSYGFEAESVIPSGGYKAALVEIKGDTSLTGCHIYKYQLMKYAGDSKNAASGSYIGYIVTEYINLPVKERYLRQIVTTLWPELTFENYMRMENRSVLVGTECNVIVYRERCKEQEEIRIKLVTVEQAEEGDNIDALEFDEIENRGCEADVNEVDVEDLEEEERDKSLDDEYDDSEEDESNSEEENGSEINDHVMIDFVSGRESHSAEMDISDINIDNRHRRDLGDIYSLVDSIKEIGLLHPVVINEQHVLVAGMRRLEAYKKMNRKKIPVRIIDFDDILRGEHDENVVRKNFTPSEAVAISRALEPSEKKAAKERQLSNLMAGNKSPRSANLTERGKGEARTKVASKIGFGYTTLSKATEIVDAAESEPDKFQHLLETMDKTGKVDAAYKKLIKIRKLEELNIENVIIPNSEKCKLFLGDFRKEKIKSESVDVIITDPPYSKEFLPLYEDLAQFAKKVLKPDGCIIVMSGQSYLTTVVESLSKHLTYQWTFAYLTPAKTTKLWSKEISSYWKPVFIFSKSDKYSGGWMNDVVKAGCANDDRMLHEWGQNLEGISEIVERVSKQGDMVFDPMMGTGTTGIACIRLKRRFVGIEINNDTYMKAKSRISREMNGQ